MKGKKLQTLDINGEKAELSYPCEWLYKVISTDQQSIVKVAKEILPTQKYTLTPSNKSKSNKFFSMNLKTVVPNEEERNRIYQELKQHPSIKMVL